MNIGKKIKTSFINSCKGQESSRVISWFWGGIFFFLALFVIDPLIRKIPYKSIDLFLVIFCIIYAIWHAFVVIRCFPKVPKLSKEEKEQIKIQRGGLYNAFARKLFLREPITKMNPRTVMILCDIFIILHFIAFTY